jgi:hypothetical protein
VTTDANGIAPGQQRYFNGTEAQSVAANFPALGGVSTHSRHWNIQCFGIGTRASQYATEVFGVGTTRDRTFVRSLHDATWSDWTEISFQSPITISSTTISAVSGDFTAGTIHLCRVGNQVVMQWDGAACVSKTQAESLDGIIPAAYRPVAQAQTAYSAATVVKTMSIQTTGKIISSHRDWSGLPVTSSVINNGSIAFIA